MLDLYEKKKETFQLLRYIKKKKAFFFFKKKNYHYLITGDSLKASEFLAKIRQANGMMKDPVGSVIIGVWATNDANQRQIFTVSTGDSVKHAKPTNGEGHDTGADPTRASVPIGSVSGIQLVTATDQVEPGLGYQVVE